VTHDPVPDSWHESITTTHVRDPFTFIDPFDPRPTNPLSALLPRTSDNGAGFQAVKS